MSDLDDDHFGVCGGSGTCYVIESFLDNGKGAKDLILKNAITEETLEKVSLYFEGDGDTTFKKLQMASFACSAVFVWCSAVYSLAVEAHRQGLGTSPVESLLLNDLLSEQVETYKEGEEKLRKMRRADFQELKAMARPPAAVMDCIVAVEVMCGKSYSKK